MRERVRGAASDFSPERLNQIAARKLQALGVDVDLAEDGRTLQGEWVFESGRLPHPSGSGFITRAPFRVLGHDRLQFRTAPLQGLDPIFFYELPSAAAVGDRVVAALRARMGLLKDLAARLARLRVQCTLDVELLALKGTLTSVEFRFELLALPDGVRVFRVAPLHGKPYSVSPGFPPLDISQMQTPTDLEMELAQLEPKMRESQVVAAPKSTGLQLVAPPEGTLTLAMLAERFGPRATLVPGPRLEVHQELDIDGVRYRFVAQHEGQTRFHGRLRDASGERWADKFSLENFPGVGQVASAILGVADRGTTSGSPELSATTETGSATAELGARVGEVWVMNVLIEREVEGEVRYACLDVNGRLYGAARVLPASEFRVLFNQHGSGWRLCIVIEQSEPDKVVYRQLDSTRQPRGTPKTLATSILLANFSPEAASY